MAPAPNLRGGGGKGKTTKLQKAAEIHFLLVSYPAPCDLSWSQGVRKQLTGLLVFGTMYNEMANIWPDEPTLFLAQNTADVWFSSIHSLIQSATLQVLEPPHQRMLPIDAQTSYGSFSPVPWPFSLKLSHAPSHLQGRSPKLAVAKMRLVAQWGQLQPQECAVSTHEALLRSSVSIVTVVTKGPPKLPAACPAA